MNRFIAKLIKPTAITTCFHTAAAAAAAVATTTTTTVNPDQLLRVCTILFQQQDASDSRLHKSLLTSITPINNLTQEFFLQVCNTFPLSWRPVYRFFLFTKTLPNPALTHNSLTFNKVLDVVGQSRNIDLFWDIATHMASHRLVNNSTVRIVFKTLAEVRELKKCIKYFHLMSENGLEYQVETLELVVEILCRNKLVSEARFVVLKMSEWIKPNGVVYGWLVKGFCDLGDLVEACKVWNLMMEVGCEARVCVVESLMERFFMSNRYDEAMRLFEMMRAESSSELGVSSYRMVIKWLCKRGKVFQASMVFEEMHKKGFEGDGGTIGSLIYGLLARGRVREAYRIVDKIERPDISVYHGLIKGLLKLKRASDATQVFREMIKRGCEPIMHTYIMLLQGHLGKRGRKGLDELLNFDNIFVGGLVKAGKSLEASKFVERSMNRGLEVPRFDYNKFLHYYSNEEGVVMFEEVSKKLREAGMVDLADILQRYGEKMATRDRRRNREAEMQ